MLLPEILNMLDFSLKDAQNADLRAMRRHLESVESAILQKCDKALLLETLEDALLGRFCTDIHTQKQLFESKVIKQKTKYL